MTQSDLRRTTAARHLILKAGLRRAHNDLARQSSHPARPTTPHDGSLQAVKSAHLDEDTGAQHRVDDRLQPVLRGHLEMRG